MQTAARGWSLWSCEARLVVTDPTLLDAASSIAGALVTGAGGTGWLRGIGLPARLVDHAGGVHTLNGFPTEQAA